MEKREYGSTGERLSIVGLGGILVSQVEADEASRLVAEAVDRGVDYFDVAPTYGNAQEMLGPALEPFRKDVFLACKTTERTVDGARRELEESLRLLRTDHVDLYQLHAVNTDEDFDQVTGPGGALELFREAKERGMTRYLGFSSHSSETALRLIEAVDFDSVLFPVNWCTWFGADFGPAVVAAAEARGTARLALKALARGKMAPGTERRWAKCWYEPLEDRELADLALRFALSQSVTAAIPPGEPALFRMALEIAEGFTPITAEEAARLRREAASGRPIFELAA